MTRSTDQPINRSTKPPVSGGFTLVELLVVIAIIVALLAILLPSMNRAIGLAQRAVCLSNARQQAYAQLNYASDNLGNFPAAGFRWDPQYVRSGANSPANWWEPMENGRYIADAMILLCPLVSTQGWGVIWEKIDGVDPGAPDYGNWRGPYVAAPITSPGNIFLNYAWMGGFAPPYMVATEVGEPAPPLGLRSPGNPCLITHRITSHPSASYDVGHGGACLVAAGIGSYQDISSTDQPIVYLDASGELRSRTQFRPRFQSLYGGWYYY